jgi:hypothetical protein
MFLVYILWYLLAAGFIASGCGMIPQLHNDHPIFTIILGVMMLCTSFSTSNKDD